MLWTIALLASGFLAGAALTAIIAVHIYGLLYQDAVQAIDSYGGLWLTTRPAARPRGVAER